MEKIDVNKSFLEELAQNRNQYQYGNYGYIINRNNGYCFKIYRHFLDDIVEKGEFIVPKTRSKRDLELIKNFDEVRESIYPVEPPIGILFYNDQYIGNIQKYYGGYETYRKGISDRNENKLDLEKQFFYLSKILEIIKSLGDQGITYHDMHSSNFIFKNDDIKLIDLDDGERISFYSSKDEIDYMYDLFCRYMLQTHFRRKYNFDIYLSMFRDYNYENSQRYLEYVSEKVLKQSK